MTVQYITDEHGRKLAAVVPIDEWEALRVMNLEYAEDEIPPEELAEADAAWAGYQADPSTAQPVEDVMREFGIDPKNGSFTRPVERVQEKAGGGQQRADCFWKITLGGSPTCSTTAYGI